MKQAMATAREYTETQKAWAVALYRTNVPSSEVEKRTGVKANYVRTLSKRLPDDVEKVEAVAIAPVSPVSTPETPAPNVTKKRETRRFNFTKLDVVFYATTLTTCAGLVTLLQWWGLPVAVVYSLILVDAMDTAKDARLKEAAQAGAMAVLFFEVIAGCVHAYAFNKVIWMNYKSLPFRVGDKFVGEVWVVENEDKPWLIALGIAVVLSGSALYAIHKSIITAKELAKIEVK